MSTEAVVKKTATRTYKVVELDGVKVLSKRLVKATNPARALKHVVTPRYLVEVAEMDEVVALVQAGTQVEIAATEE